MLAKFSPEQAFVLQPIERPANTIIVRIEKVQPNGDLFLIGLYTWGQKLRSIYAVGSDVDARVLLLGIERQEFLIVQEIPR